MNTPADFEAWFDQRPIEFPEKNRRFPGGPANSIVWRVQCLLEQLGFDPFWCDGMDGRRTRDAVAAFLTKRLGFEVQGGVDLPGQPAMKNQKTNPHNPELWAQLRDALEARHRPSPKPFPSDEEPHYF